MSQIIKATHIIDNNTLVFNNTYNQNIYLKDQKLPNKDCVIRYEDKDNVYQKSLSNIIDHYIHREIEDKTLSVGEYNKESCYLNIVDEDDNWPNLDSEFAYRKFLAEWKPVYKTIEVTTNIEFDIVEVTYDTKSPYIESVWNHSNVPQEDRLYRLNICQLEIDTFVELCSKHKLNYEIPTHSHLRFAKVENHYAFNEGYDRRNTYIYDNLEKLHKLQEKIISQITDIVEIEVAKKIPKLNIDWPNVLEQLKSIKQRLGKIDYKVKSEVIPCDIQRNVERIIETIEQAAITALHPKK